MGELMDSATLRHVVSSASRVSFIQHTEYSLNFVVMSTIPDYPFPIVVKLSKKETVPNGDSRDQEFFNWIKIQHLQKSLSQKKNMMAYNLLPQFLQRESITWSNVSQEKIPKILIEAAMKKKDENRLISSLYDNESSFHVYATRYIENLVPMTQFIDEIQLQNTYNKEQKEKDVISLLIQAACFLCIVQEQYPLFVHNDFVFNIHICRVPSYTFSCNIKSGKHYVPVNIKTTIRVVILDFDSSLFMPDDYDYQFNYHNSYVNRILNIGEKESSSYSDWACLLCTLFEIFAHDDSEYDKLKTILKDYLPKELQGETFEGLSRVIIHDDGHLYTPYTMNHRLTQFVRVKCNRTDVFPLSLTDANHINSDMATFAQNRIPPMFLPHMSSARFPFSVKDEQFVQKIKKPSEIMHDTRLFN